jgi:hypothetical protein
MDRLGKIFALLLVFLFLLSLVMLPNSIVRAQSKTIIVPNDYPTISSAIVNATNGDTIFVKEGIYEEQKLTINKSLQIIAEENRVTRINLHPAWTQTEFFTSWGTPEYGYENCIEISANNVKLSGFSINSLGGLFMVTSTGNQISQNKITTGLFLVNANQLIAQNLIKGGLTCGEGSDNSVVEGNFLDGIWCGIVNGVIIRNNIIDGGGIGFAESGNQAFNNTIRNSHSGIYF